MKLHPFSSIRPYLNYSIYIGPYSFLGGIIIALLGQVARQTNIILTGLILTAAGLIIWGCHGIRRRGRRPGFLLMTFFGSLFFLLHLYYRYSDYRWAKINTMAFPSTTSATLTHLESRAVLFFSIFLISVAIGLFSPLPEVNTPRKFFRDED